MEKGVTRVLVADASQATLELIKRLLPDCEVIGTDSGTRALAFLENEDPYALVVSDLQLPDLEGMVLLREAKRCSPDTPVILMTAQAEVEGAVEAMRAGAFDYLSRPFEPEQAALIMQRALEMGRLRRQTSRLQLELEVARGFGQCSALRGTQIAYVREVLFAPHVVSLHDYLVRGPRLEKH